MIDSDKCDPEVYAKGTHVGLFDMTKEEAQEHCKRATTLTGYKHDWYFAGGRVHIKALLPEVK